MSTAVVDLGGIDDISSGVVDNSDPSRLTAGIYLEP
jgi:hypothetical protein